MIKLIVIFILLLALLVLGVTVRKKERRKIVGQWLKLDIVDPIRRRLKFLP